MYIYRYMGRRRPVCSVYIVYISIYTEIYCTPISAADGSRHRYIHRYMPIYYARRRVFSAHSSTPPLTAAGITIYTPIHTPIYADILC